MPASCSPRPPRRARRPLSQRNRLALTIAITVAATLVVVLLGNRGRGDQEPVSGQGPAMVDLLTLAPASDGAGYDRELFPTWNDADGDGCDTRDEVLLAESLAPTTLGPDGCPTRGRWKSLYDGYTTDDPAELEVDHTVALAEAWRSGAAAWTPTRRQAFANDLAYAGALVAVSSATNQAKSDRDPASWQPPDREASCEFATSWVHTKYRWGLTMDDAEAVALRNLLRGCPAVAAPALAP